MARSIQWRLQAWHAAMLVAVLTIFGAVVYGLQWQTRLQSIDADLDRTTDVLSSRLRRLVTFPFFRWPPRPPGAPGRPPTEVNVPAVAEIPGEPLPVERPAGQGEGRGLRGEPPRGPGDFVRVDRGSPNETASAASRTGDGQPRTPPMWSWGPDGRGGFVFGPALNPPAAGQPPPGSPGGPPADPNASGPFALTALGDRRTPSLQLPEEFAQQFDSEEPSHRYYSIWDKDGKLLAKSGGAPELEFPKLRLAEGNIPVRTVRSRGNLREVIHVSRFEMNVLVGRSIEEDLAAQHASGWALAGVGLGVLGIGLLGGWWSASRAIRSIAVMTHSAQEISAQNISKRLDVSETDDELGQLAVVLNETFDRIQAAFERQLRFTADASHELRTPVAVILANTDLALSRPRSAEDYREALEACRRAAQRMRSLIESLLSLARFDSGHPTLSLARVDLTQVVQDAAGLVKPLADQKRIQIHLSADPATVEGDRERLSEVITNLLANAIRYNREDGTVSIVVNGDAQQVRLTVTDQGIGIPPEHLPHIFERFYRVDKARNRNDGGSGLGLAICRTIVEAHHGAISATSKAGEGTTFEVRLPRLHETTAI